MIIYNLPDVKLGIHYINDEAKELYEKNGGIMEEGSAGFDLLTTEDIFYDKMVPFQTALIPLGLIINIPKGFYAEIVPRSSTFKKYGLLQANSVGIIDESYCGPEDQLFWAAIYANRKAVDRIANDNYKGQEMVMMNTPLGGFNPNLDDTPLRQVPKPDIPKGTRLCQLLIKESIKFDTYDYNPKGDSRGGFGSTGN